MKTKIFFLSAFAGAMIFWCYAANKAGAGPFAYFIIFLAALLYSYLFGVIAQIAIGELHPEDSKKLLEKIPLAIAIFFFPVGFSQTVANFVAGRFILA